MGDIKKGVYDLDESTINQEAKNFLRSGTPIPDEAVRPEILRSWKRCWGSHVPMEHGNKEILPLDAVEERIARRNSLCQVAFPYLDGLYDFIRGSEFLLLFSDEEGYILYARGDEDISRTARENGLVKGGLPQRIPAGHQRDRHGLGGPDPPPSLWGGALLRGTCQLGLLRRIGLSARWRHRRRGLPVRHGGACERSHSGHGGGRSRCHFSAAEAERCLRPAVQELPQLVRYHRDGAHGHVSAGRVPPCGSL